MEKDLKFNVQRWMLNVELQIVAKFKFKFKFVPKLQVTWLTRHSPWRYTMSWATTARPWWVFFLKFFFLLIRRLVLTTWRHDPLVATSSTTTTYYGPTATSHNTGNRYQKPHFCRMWPLPCKRSCISDHLHQEKTRMGLLLSIFWTFSPEKVQRIHVRWPVLWRLLQ